MKIEITLNKNCNNFEDLDWYIVQHSSNYWGGISYIDGVGYWLDDLQLIRDNNRYYTIYCDDEPLEDRILPLLHYVKHVSKERCIFTVIDGKVNLI